MNEGKTLVKHISRDYEFKLNSTTYTTYISNQKQYNDKCQCKCKKYFGCKKGL